MVQLSEFIKKDKTDVTEEDIKEAYDYIKSLLEERLKASKKDKESMLIHFRSGETISFLLSDINNISFE